MIGVADTQFLEEMNRFGFFCVVVEDIIICGRVWRKKLDFFSSKFLLFYLWPYDKVLLKPSLINNYKKN